MSTGKMVNSPEMAQAVALSTSSAKDRRRMLGCLGQLWEVTRKNTVNKAKVVMQI